MSYEIIKQKPEFCGPVRGVLFDMDGVILDSEKLYTRFWAEASRFYGFPMTFQQALGLRSLNHQTADAYLTSLFGPAIQYPLVHAKRVELMADFIDKFGVEAKPGVAELTAFLQKERIPYAVATASPADRVKDHLGRLGLLEQFPVICTVHQVRCGKPEPDIYLFAAQSIGVSPEACLALEDSYNGMLSANRAGCRATIVPDLDQPGDAILSLAYARADSLPDVIDIIQETKNCRHGSQHT